MAPPPLVFIGTNTDLIETLHVDFSLIFQNFLNFVDIVETRYSILTLHFSHFRKLRRNLLSKQKSKTFYGIPLNDSIPVK